MADPVTLIFKDNRPAEHPGVHTIVIGIGDYKHFPGGAGHEYSGHGNMGQLSSPCHSARHVADWLFDTYHDDAEMPLRSLRMLLSDPDGNGTYAHILSPEKPIPEATLSNVKMAIREWKAQGDESKANLMVFYFCGHGISSGTQHTLLCTDFGSDEADVFENAINFNDFHRGMDRCTARAQCFFVDACRVGSPELMESAVSRGQSIIGGLITFAEHTRSAPIFRSSLPGATAFGLSGKPSAFAQALPLAFKGGAWRQHQGKWVVCTSRLKLALETQIKRIMHIFKNLDRRVVSDHDVTLTLKTPSGQPIVPIEIGCDPIEANEKATLCYRSGTVGKVCRPSPARDEWFLDLEKGNYSFEATFPNGEFNDNRLDDEIVFPPEVSPRIPVT